MLGIALSFLGRFTPSTHPFVALGNPLSGLAMVGLAWWLYRAASESRAGGSSAPLGWALTVAAFAAVAAIRKCFPTLATPHGSYAVATSFCDNPTLAGCGAILSTANDLLTFLRGNMGITDTELRPALQLASTPQRPGEPLAYIGLGWNLPGSGNGIHYHGRGNFGYSSFLAWDSERKIGVVVLMNVYAGPKEYLGYYLMRGLPKPFPVDPQVLAAYAGRYQYGDYIVTLRVDGAHIYFRGDQESELIAISENQFCWLDANAEIVFYKNDRGEVDRMEVVGIGGTLVFIRIP